MDKLKFLGFFDKGNPHAQHDLDVLSRQVLEPKPLETSMMVTYLGYYLNVKRYAEQNSMAIGPEELAGKLAEAVHRWSLSLAPAILEQWCNSWDNDSIARILDIDTELVSYVLRTQIYEPFQVSELCFNNLCQRARFASSVLPMLNKKLLAN